MYVARPLKYVDKICTRKGVKGEVDGRHEEEDRETIDAEEGNDGSE